MCAVLMTATAQGSDAEYVHTLPVALSRLLIVGLPSPVNYALCQSLVGWIVFEAAC